MRRLARSAGFALPTVVIVGTVLFGVMVVVLGSTSSVRTTLDTQFYEALARDAAESGAVHANGCLSVGGYTAQWSSSSMLRPNTTCTGGAACTSTASCFITSTNEYNTTYSVSGVVDSGSGTQTVQVTGLTQLKRKSNGSIWKTYTYVVKQAIGGQVRGQATTLGYAGFQGVFYAVHGSDGKLRVAGLNNWGQLGQGDNVNKSIPVEYKVSGSSSTIVGSHANFVSLARTFHVQMSNGEVWGSGQNDLGQLGNGATVAEQRTPVKFNLPAGKSARSVLSDGWATFVVTTDDNIYAAGGCMEGLLGSNYTIAGCTNQSTPVRVALPTPNAGDLNTLPSNSFTTDLNNAYIVMRGGRVYGWGYNSWGQLANGTFTSSSVPVKIGTYGDAGQPKAVQVAFDGETVYILDDTGKVKSAGHNRYGQSGNDLARLYLSLYGRCLGNNNGDAQTITFGVCDNSDRQYWRINTNGLIYSVSTSSTKCLDNTGADGINLWLYACNGSLAQQFDPVYPSQYRIRLNGKYIDNYGFDLVSAKLHEANGGNNQVIAAVNTSLVPFSGWSDTWQKKIIKISADQSSVSVLTDEGEVWSAGSNNSGMFGDGTQAYYNPYPRKFALPAGVYAVDLYNTYSYDPNNTQWQNLYVIGDNGRVYGAGSNVYGQLGNGTTAATVSTPVAMNTVGTINGKAVSVQAGYGTAVVRTSSGAIYTVGNNNNGQLGDGTTTNSSVPILGKYLNGVTPTTY